MRTRSKGALVSCRTWRTLRRAGGFLKSISQYNVGLGYGMVAVQAVTRMHVVGGRWEQENLPFWERDRRFIAAGSRSGCFNVLAVLRDLNFASHLPQNSNTSTWDREGTLAFWERTNPSVVVKVKLRTHRFKHEGLGLVARMKQTRV